MKRRVFIDLGLLLLPRTALGKAGTIDVVVQEKKATVSVKALVPFDRNISRSVNAILFGIRENARSSRKKVEDFLMPLKSLLTNKLGRKIPDPRVFLSKQGDLAIQAVIPFRACNVNDCGPQSPILASLTSESESILVSWGATITGAARFDDSRPNIVGVRVQIDFDLEFNPYKGDIKSRNTRNVARTLVIDVMKIYDKYIPEAYDGLHIESLPESYDERFLPEFDW